MRKNGRLALLSLFTSLGFAAGVEPAHGFSYQLAQTFTSMNPLSGAAYGAAVVAAAGRNIVVGAPGASAVYLYDGTTGTLRTFQNPIPSSGDNFGYSVAATPDRLLVGAPYDDRGAVDSGSAFLFDLATGTVLKTFLNPTPASGDRFGISVALVAGRALIGADGDDTAGTNAGAVYYFAPGGDSEPNGQLLLAITKPPPIGTSAFGVSVGAVGSHFLVGDPADGTGAPATGAAFLFDGREFIFENGQFMQNPNWGGLLTTFRRPTPLANANFGTAVGQHGGYALIGAPAYGAGGTVAGTAYVFDGDLESATFGTLLRTLAKSPPSPGDWFGYSIAASGTYALVGAPKDDTGATDTGAAYLFNATNGSLLATFTNPTPAAQEEFGYSVGAGCQAVIGAPQDGTAGPLAGAAYSFSQVAPPSQFGQWEGVQQWPVQAIHASVQPNGKVLFFQTGGYNGLASYTNTYTWDPVSQTVTQLASVPRGDMFCSGHATLSDGRFIVFGGIFILAFNRFMNIFDPFTQSWACPYGGMCSLPNMAEVRFYPTATTLSDGKVLATAGAPPPNQDLHEVYDVVNNTWTSLTNARKALPTYPFMFVMPDGKVFQAGPTTATYILDVTPANVSAWTWGSTNFASQTKGGSAVLYRGGTDFQGGTEFKVLKSGGESQSGQDNPPSARAEVIDMIAMPQTWRDATSMAFPRANHTLVVLPDGKVLVTGGAATGRGSEDAPPQDGVLDAEMWDPTPAPTGTWTTMSCMADPRMYHSVAVLLPNGKVLTAGGEGFKSAQVYSPPYLFGSSQPVISSAPPEVLYTESFDVMTAQSASIQKAIFIRPGAVTHGFDQNQRYVSLNFTTGSGKVTVTAPASGGEAPPGYYMLFLVDNTGVPSEARFVRLKGCG